MFCYNCGTKLVENAMFCSSCGTAVQAAPQQAAQSSSYGATANTQETHRHMDVFNLLGFEVALPKETRDYVSIRGGFLRLAVEAREQMARHFDARYRSLDDLVRHGDDDTEALFDAALQHAMEELKRRGIYNVNISRFLDAAANYTGYWDAHFSDIREKFAELIEYKEAKKNYRSNRKDSRGRIIGGGFGVGGAVKGMAMAGTANMATGLLHSFSNAVGNAATSAEVSNLKNKLFKDPDTRRTLGSAIYFDIFYLHLAVVDCINDRGLSLAAASYGSDEREEAMTIYNNIMNGSVRRDDVQRMIAETLEKDPFDMDYYDLALKFWNLEDHDLIEYANYFEMPIEKSIHRMTAELESNERLAQTFGAASVELENKLQHNSLYRVIKSELSKDPAQAILKAFYAIQNESTKSKVFLAQVDSSEKLAKKLDNVRASYARLQSDRPILLFDNTAFGSAKDGFLLTDQRIYVHNMMSKEWSCSFQEIEKMSLSGSNILIDGKSVDINLISGKDRESFYEFVELAVYVQKYGGTLLAASGELTNHDASMEIRSMMLEASATTTAATATATTATAATTASVVGELALTKDKVIEDIQSTVLGMTNAGIRKYVFIYNENEKVNKKFQNAIQAYAALQADEKVIFLFDNTAFGGAKDGFLMTDRRIYIHNMMEKPVVVEIRNIVSVELSGSKISFNKDVVQVNLIDSSARPAFRAYLEDFIARLK